MSWSVLGVGDVVLKTVDVFVSLPFLATGHGASEGLQDCRSVMGGLEVVKQERWRRAGKCAVGDGTAVRLIFVWACIVPVVVLIRVPRLVAVVQTAIILIELAVVEAVVGGMPLLPCSLCVLVVIVIGIHECL